MSLSDRAYLMKRALLRTLAECGDYLLRESALFEQATLKVDFLDPTLSELKSALRAAEAAQLVLGIAAERDRKWKLTDAGRAWLAENP